MESLWLYSRECKISKKRQVFRFFRENRQKSEKLTKFIRKSKWQSRKSQNFFML